MPTTHPHPTGRRPGLLGLLHHLYYLVMRQACWWCFILVFGGRAWGQRRVPRRGGVLLVSNHQSFLDPILATLAFRTSVDLKDIHTEGITAVSRQDVVNAAELGCRIKLLAIAKASGGVLELRVHPTMIPANSPLAAVSGVFNAVFITGDNVGDLMFYGRGAGQLPTASAVWSDTVEIARRVANGIPAMDVDLPSVSRRPLPLRPMDDIRSTYYLRVMAMDRPGVLAQVAGILGKHDISLVSVLQKGRAHGGAVPVVMMTHEARERDMRAALAAIDKLPVVASRTTMIRMEVE